MDITNLNFKKLSKDWAALDSGEWAAQWNALSEEEKSDEECAPKVPYFYCNTEPNDPTFVYEEGPVFASICFSRRNDTALIMLRSTAGWHSTSGDITYSCSPEKFPDSVEEAFAAVFSEATHTMVSGDAAQIVDDSGGTIVEDNPGFFRANREILRTLLTNFYWCLLSV